MKAMRMSETRVHGKRRRLGRLCKSWNHGNRNAVVDCQYIVLRRELLGQEELIEANGEEISPSLHQSCRDLADLIYGLSSKENCTE